MAKIKEINADSESQLPNPQRPSWGSWLLASTTATVNWVVEKLEGYVQAARYIKPDYTILLILSAAIRDYNRQHPDNEPIQPSTYYPPIVFASLELALLAPALYTVFRRDVSKHYYLQRLGSFLNEAVIRPINASLTAFSLSALTDYAAFVLLHLPAHLVGSAVLVIGSGFQAYYLPEKELSVAEVRKGLEILLKELAMLKSTQRSEWSKLPLKLLRVDDKNPLQSLTLTNGTLRTQIDRMSPLVNIERLPSSSHKNLLSKILDRSLPVSLRNSDEAAIAFTTLGAVFEALTATIFLSVLLGDPTALVFPSFTTMLIGSTLGGLLHLFGVMGKYAYDRPILGYSTYLKFVFPSINASFLALLIIYSLRVLPHDLITGTYEEEPGNKFHDDPVQKAALVTFINNLLLSEILFFPASMRSYGRNDRLLRQVVTLLKELEGNELAETTLPQELAAVVIDTSVSPKDSGSLPSTPIQIGRSDSPSVVISDPESSPGRGGDSPGSSGSQKPLLAGKGKNSPPKDGHRGDLFRLSFNNKSKAAAPAEGGGPAFWSVPSPRPEDSSIIPGASLPALESPKTTSEQAPNTTSELASPRFGL